MFHHVAAIMSCPERGLTLLRRGRPLTLAPERCGYVHYQTALMILPVEELGGISRDGSVVDHEHIHLAGHDEQPADLIQP